MYQFSQTLQSAISSGAPQRALIEFENGATFSNEEIMMETGVKLNCKFNSETDLTVGMCPSAEINFSLLNDTMQLEEFEFGRFTAYLGARIDSGTPAQTAKTATFEEHGVERLYEFAPLGVFIAKRPNVVRTDTIEVRANDLMQLFDVDMPDTDALDITYPTTLGTLVQKMCDYVNVTLGTTTFMNSTLAVAKKPDVFDTSTMREILGLVAEAACSMAMFNRDGELEIRWFNQTNKVYDENDYADLSQYWYETNRVDGLHIRNADSTAEYTVGEGENAYMIQDNPFLRQPD